MSQGIENPDPAPHGQQVLVLQGGGALGAYQVGVYQALDQFGIDIDWVVGTSIGAINAAIIAGSPRAERMHRMRAFWKRVEHGHVFDDILPSLLSSPLRNWLAVSTGIAGFFKPRALAFLSPHLTLGPGEAGYYSVTRLKDTLSDLIEFDLLKTGSTRLTVGAANVETSEMTYFDSRAMALDIRHVLASGALPPAFPAVEIDAHHHWDGAYSPTPRSKWYSTTIRAAIRSCMPSTSGIPKAPRRKRCRRSRTAERTCSIRAARPPISRASGSSTVSATSLPSWRTCYPSRTARIPRFATSQVMAVVRGCM
jgi:predicted acylesterase/phospholipase RssA